MVGGEYMEWDARPVTSAKMSITTSAVTSELGASSAVLILFCNTEIFSYLPHHNLWPLILRSAFRGGVLRLSVADSIMTGGPASAPPCCPFDRQI